MFFRIFPNITQALSGHWRSSSTTPRSCCCCSAPSPATTPATLNFSDRPLPRRAFRPQQFSLRQHRQHPAGYYSHRKAERLSIDSLVPPTHAGLADDAIDAATAPAPYPLACGMIKSLAGIDRGHAVEHAGRHRRVRGRCRRDPADDIGVFLDAALARAALEAACDEPLDVQGAEVDEGPLGTPQREDDVAPPRAEIDETRLGEPATAAPQRPKPLTIRHRPRLVGRSISGPARCSSGARSRLSRRCRLTRPSATPAARFASPPGRCASASRRRIAQMPQRPLQAWKKDAGRGATTCNPELRSSRSRPPSVLTWAQASKRKDARCVR